MQAFRDNDGPAVALADEIHGKKLSFDTIFADGAFFRFAREFDVVLPANVTRFGNDDKA